MRQSRGTIHLIYDTISRQKIATPPHLSTWSLALVAEESTHLFWHYAMDASRVSKGHYWQGVIIYLASFFSVTFHDNDISYLGK